MISRSNSLYTRPTRCILLFMQMYFYLFWSTVLISGKASALDHPQARLDISGVIADNLWMPVVVPVLVTLIMYIFSGMFKLREGKVFACKSIAQYRRIKKEVLKECIVRRLIGLILSSIAVVGMTVFIIRFSANYGWKISSECIWCSLLSLGFDMIIYDGLIALFLSFTYPRCRNCALWIHD